jgi:anthranilate synthase component 1
MKNKISIKLVQQELLADKITPVQTYLQLRDKYRMCALLESTDFHVQKGKFSFIGCDPIAHITVKEGIRRAEIQGEEVPLYSERVDESIQEFIDKFEVEDKDSPSSGLYGYISYDAIPYFEDIEFRKKEKHDVADISLQLYRYIIAFDHFHQRVKFYENVVEGTESRINKLIEQTFKTGSMYFPFEKKGAESSNMEDEDYRNIVSKSIEHCYRGDVFQMVPSRRFQQGFIGDDFNVYRALRAVNPSPYLFYFDYEDFHLMGSSPETQIRIEDGYASIDPIAGTVKRTGDPEIDEVSKKALLADEKENAEHVMLVDLARNDLSRNAREVEVKSYKEIISFSHVMHIVSQVQGKLKEDTNPIRVFGDTFPAGTLSGAPKYRALELIDKYEPTARNFYGGSIGFIGFNGNINHAIFIRSFLSKDHTLFYQAGAGVVASSKPENELQEVNNKLGALKKAIELAQKIER